MAVVKFVGSILLMQILLYLFKWFLFSSRVGVLGSDFTFNGSQMTTQDVYNTIKTYLKTGEIVFSFLQKHSYSLLKGTLPFLKIGSFYNSPRVKQLSFTIFQSIQPIAGSGGSTFSLA